MLASGAAVPIASLKPGEKVLATNVKTGKTSAEPVTAVLVHHDTNRYDLTVKTSHGSAVIQTTKAHLFWDPYHHYWVSANELSKGEHLQTPDGQSAVVVGGSVPADHDGWMRDLTVQDDHDFYVEPAVVLPPSRAGPTVAVLVHNCTVDPTTVKFSQRSVSARFKNGATIEDTVAGIRAGDIDPSDFPPIRLVERDGDLYTLDNRRLVTFQKAGLAEVPYVMATPEEVGSEMWKFDPDATGTSIKIRGTGEVWAP